MLRGLAAAPDRGDASKLVELALQDAPALHVTAVPLCAAADAFVALKRCDDALRLLVIARGRFPKAIRPRQLEGLALRRKAALVKAPDEQLALVQAALEVFSLLHTDGHRDPETLGIYAATWTIRYRVEGRRLHLESAQELYEEAFRLTPSDSYVGGNAASKLSSSDRRTGRASSRGRCSSW